MENSADKNDEIWNQAAELAKDRTLMKVEAYYYLKKGYTADFILGMHNHACSHNITIEQAVGAFEVNAKRLIEKTEAAAADDYYVSGQDGLHGPCDKETALALQYRVLRRRGGEQQGDDQLDDGPHDNHGPGDLGRRASLSATDPKE